SSSSFFLFHAPATPEIYTLSLHDALPISRLAHPRGPAHAVREPLRRIGKLEVDDQSDVVDVDAAGGDVGGHQDPAAAIAERGHGDRKSTRLNSSHRTISYAVFCLKKKKKE